MPSSVVTALPRDGRDRCHAGTDLLAVQQHRAGTALRETATEARPVQVQLVVQDVEERGVEARGHVVHETVHLDLELARHYASIHFQGMLRPGVGRRRVLGKNRRYQEKLSSVSG